MPVSLPSLSLIYALLVLLPGFLAYKVARRRGKINEEFDRFDKAIYTVIGSGIAFSIAILGYSLVTQTVLEEVSQSEFLLAELGLIYLFMVVFSLILGYVAGYVLDWHLHGKDTVTNETTWQLLTEKKEEPAKVYVVMSNGDEISGYIQMTDSEPHGQDILLEYPEIVSRKDGTNVKEASVGNHVFLSQSDISHIFFETEVDLLNS